MVITIKYKIGVKTFAGHRSVCVQALAEKISDARARVVEVVLIDGEIPTRDMSRTGANRQRYNGAYYAMQEVGKTKNLSACEIVQ